MRQIVKDSTNQSVHLYIIDSGDGTPETGVVFNTSGIDLRYRREGAVAVAITEIDLATPALTDAHEDGGFLEIGNGVYRLDVPDAAFATGAELVSIFGTVTGMVVIPIDIQLTGVDVQDATPAVDLTHIMGTILTEGDSGRLAAALIKLLDVATPTLVASDVMRGTDGANTTTPNTVTPPTVSQLNARTIVSADYATAAGVAAIPTTAMRGTDGANTTTPPTVGAIADGVWDEEQSAHTNAGTFGKFLDAVVSAVSAPSAVTVAAAVWDRLKSLHSIAGSFGKFLDAAISGVGGAVGSGSTSTTLVIKDGSNNAIQDCEVWVSNDLAGSNVVAGTIETNAQGEVTFLLDPGTYYRWAQKAGQNFTNPQSFTVS